MSLFVGSSSALLLFRVKKAFDRFRGFASGKAALAAAFVFGFSLAFISCPATLDGDSFSIQVSGVDVTPNPLSATVARGSNTTFYAKVDGTDNQNMRWEILESGRSQNTLITPGQSAGAARLTVGRGEGLNRITVRVTAEVDSLVFADIAVKVLDATVDIVTVEPSTLTVSPGGSGTFTATVDGENKPTQEVTWEILESGRNAGTVIENYDTHINLYVSENETLPTLTIKATSVLNEQKFGIAKVTVAQSGDGSDPVITGVTVSPRETEVARGDMAVFTAEVTGTGILDTRVGWSVIESDKNGVTNITGDGVLYVATNEALATLTVRAASVADPAQFGLATVTVISGSGSPDATITGVIVNPGSVTVTQNSTTTFKATVTGTGSSFDPSVSWSVDEAGKKTGTAISSGGVLTVAGDETLTTLTVRATSRANSSVSGRAIVTVLTGGETPEPGTPYTVTLNRQDGTGGTESVTASYGMAMPLITAPARAGYTFAGYWTYPGGYGTQYYTASGTSARAWDIAGNTTLYAYWTTSGSTPEPPAGYYTVSFNSNGGSAVPAQTVASGAILTQPPNPERDGYGFVAWYKDAAWGTEWNFASDRVNSNMTLYAKWSTVTHIVSFETYEGTPVDAQTVAHGGKVTRPPDPSLNSSYIFAGWYKDAARTNIWDFSKDTVTADTTLHAKWDKVTYPLVFDTEGGEFYGGTLPGAVEYGEKVTLPSSATRTGYTLVNFILSGAFTGTKNPGDWFTMQAGTVTVKGNWDPISYTVTYDKNDTDATGTTADSTHKYDVEKELTACGFRKTGYEFSGWAKSASGAAEYEDGEKVKNLSATQDAVVTLFAKWNTIKYTLTYIADGGSLSGGTAAGELDYGVRVTLPSSGARTGYTLSNFTLGGAASGTKNTDGTFTMPAGDVTVTVNWKPITYKVTYNKNDSAATGTTADSSHTYDVKKALSASGFSKSGGFTFAGWALSATGDKAYGDSEEVENLSATQDAVVTLYAVWTSGTYTVYFDGNYTGAPEITPITATAGQPYGTLPVPAGRQGYIFAGWYTEASGGTQVKSDTTVTLTADQILHAHWTPITYTVAYNGNGSTGGSTADSTHKYDVPRELTANGFTRTGYTFAGWATSTNGGKVYNNSASVTNLSSTDGATITLYASWTINNYSLTYNPDGGSLSGSYTAAGNITYGTTVTLPPSGTKTGYTLGGFTMSGAMTGTKTPGAAFAMPAGALTATANWTADLYNLTYNPDGGTLSGGTPAGSIAYDTLVTLPESGEKTGCTLTGFTRSDASGNYTPGGSFTMPTGNVTVTANWAPSTGNQLTYDGNGGTLSGGTAAGGITYGETVTLPSSGTRTGYTLGYFIMSGALTDTKNPGDTFPMPSGNVTAKAYWVPTPYTVTFNENGGGVPNPPTKEVIYGTYYGTLATITREGYTFDGWWTAASGGAQITAETPVSITAPQTLYAHWTANSFTVTFNKNGGGTPSFSSKTVTAGQPYGTLPEVPARTGYTWKGWNTNADGSGDTIKAATIVTPLADPPTLYAYWKPITYTVKYNENTPTAPYATGTTADSTHTYDTPQYLTLNGFTRAGFGFTGWAKSADGAMEFPDRAQVPNLSTVDGATITLYAKWSPGLFTVTFDPDGGTLSGSGTILKEAGERYEFPDVTRTGYIFGGWYTAPDGGGAQITASDRVTGDITLYAGWTPITYTVHYNGNGSTALPVTGLTADSIHTYDEPKALTANGFRRTGCDFAGWAESATGAIKYTNGESVPNLSAVQNATVNIYARWTCTVTFNGNSGTPGSATRTVFYGDICGDLPEVTRTGYTFDGWFTAASGGTKVDRDYKVDSTQTLWAQWTANTYTVTFELNGENAALSGSATKTVTYGQSYEDLPTASRTGYTWEGWFTAAIGGTGPVGALTTVLTAANHTLYAHWKVITYTVTLDRQGGTGGNTSVTARCDEAMPYMGSPPERTGYTFGGYYTSTGGGGTQYYTYSGASARNWDIAGNTTLYAKWTAKQYIVTFNGRGGTLTGSATKTVTYGETYGTLATVTLPGYKLTGWWTGLNSIGNEVSGSKVTASDIVTVTGNITLYAGWTPITYTVSYNANGGTGSMVGSAHTYDVSKALTANAFTRTGYIFAGWAESASGAVKYTNSQSVLNLSTTDGATVTLYASWTLKSTIITLNPMYGTGGPATVTAYYGSAMPALTTLPTKDGWFFGGYWTGQNGDGVQYYDAFGNSAKNWDKEDSTFTLYAKWTDGKSSVTLDPDGGTGGTESIIVTRGSAMPLITLPARTGWTFGGYYTGQNGTGDQYYTASGISAKNWDKTEGTYTLYAKWTAILYTIYFSRGSGSGGDESVTIKWGEALPHIDVPEWPTSARIFAGYWTAADSNGTQYYDGDGNPVPAGKTWNIDITPYTLYAWYYMAPDPGEYPLLYNANAPGEVATLDISGKVTPAGLVTEGDTVWLPSTGTRAGYELSGFTLSGALSGTKIPGGSFTMPPGSVRATANWTSAPGYTLTYDPAGGVLSGGTAAGRVPYGLTVNLPSTGTKEGYTLSGFTLTGALTGSRAPGAAFTMPDGPVTATANWTVNLYNLTYNSNGGTLYGGTAAGSITYGTTVTLPTSGTKSGYTLTGFTLTGALTGSFAPGATFTMPAGTVTAAANWTAITSTYALTYNPAGGSLSGGTAAGNYPSGTQITLPTSGTKSGYTLKDFTLSGTLTGSYTPGATFTMPAGAVTVTANWYGNQVTVYLDPAGGTVDPTGIVVRYGGTYENLPTPTRSGYEFLGWYTDRDIWLNKITATSTVETALNHTLYARWRER